MQSWIASMLMHVIAALLSAVTFGVIARKTSQSNELCFDTFGNAVDPHLTWEALQQAIKNFELSKGTLNDAFSRKGRKFPEARLTENAMYSVQKATRALDNVTNNIIRLMQVADPEEDSRPGTSKI